MASIRISGLTDTEKEEIEERAEQEGIPRAKWARLRLRAGIRLWDASGGFELSEVNRQFQDVSSIETQPSSESGAEGIKKTIEQNLSTTEPTSLEEIQEIVIDEVVSNAIYQLQQEGKVENVPGEGYRKR